MMRFKTFVVEHSIVKELQEAMLKTSRRNAEQYLTDFTAKYLRTASESDLEKLAKLIGKKITITGTGKSAQIVFEENDDEPLEWGTDRMTKTYKKDTPGQ